MNNDHIDQIAAELGISAPQASATAALLSEGATVPFIARYRKEATGSLDEVAVTAIRDRLGQLAELDSRREAVLKSLQQHGHLSEELRQKVFAAQTLSGLEDIYLPYRPKRRTRATIAREKGLAPLADRVFQQGDIDPASEAAAFIDPEKGVATAEDALSGARDIIAEMINEDADCRARMRELFARRAILSSRVASGRETEGAKYRDYFDWREPVCAAPSHRILAMRRGEREDILNLSLAPPEEQAVALLEGLFVKGAGPASAQVREAVGDSYKRLLSRSMETEMRLAAKERADGEAIAVFAGNLRELMLAPPLGPKRVMGIDPGFRTGCKIACLDRQGKLLAHDTAYLHLTERKDREGEDTLRSLIRRFSIEAVAVGNGTAGRETESFLRRLDLGPDIPVIMVDESGASVYSASDAAREEFPDLDLTVRGAVSIARRLMDPLSDLVNIDPKSIGVGQYQHDVDQAALKQALDDMVVSCVNAVGVDVNRASTRLLTYVSGLGPAIARNIVAHRDASGPFLSRGNLLSVPRLGPKAFEQAAGFLRITEGDNPLDGSAVHPESYPIVTAMAADLDCTVGDLIRERRLRERIRIEKYVTATVGLPTLTDILAELDKPGRDPRRQFTAFEFAAGVNTPSDLAPGMQLPGIVTNVTAFGAFVDIGVHQDGLVHISELADRFVKNPAEVVKVRQNVTVTVLSVDEARKRIALSMKTRPAEARAEKGRPDGDPKPAAPNRPAGPRGRTAARAPFNDAVAGLAGLKAGKGGKG